MRQVSAWKWLHSEYWRSMPLPSSTSMWAPGSQPGSFSPVGAPSRIVTTPSASSTRSMTTRSRYSS